MQTQTVIGEVHGLEILEGDVIEAREFRVKHRDFGPWKTYATLEGPHDVSRVCSLVPRRFRYAEFRLNRAGRIILDRSMYWARVDAGL